MVLRNQICGEVIDVLPETSGLTADSGLRTLSSSIYGVPAFLLFRVFSAGSGSFPERRGSGNAVHI